MFRKDNSKQLDLFKTTTQYLTQGSQKILNDSSSWNTVFREQFVSKIEEGPYVILFSSNMGRPNASVRILLGMMLLKEMEGWSDEQLFDECQFNLRVRSALGLLHLDDSPPCSSTYYEFRSKLARHKEVTGQDLIDQSFAQVSSEQLSTLNISGNKVRMDSKLIQSNIARQNRLQLIVESVRVSIKHIELHKLESYLNTTQFGYLKELKQKSTSNITYQLSKPEKEAMLVDFGHILLALYKTGYIDEQSILYKILCEQYSFELGDDDDSQDQIELQAPTQISSGSIQSIHDTEATYRKKGKDNNVQIVQGYHSNITETCDKQNEINLITDVITAPANVSEDQFLQPALQSSQEVLGQNKPIKECNTDGGYDSIANRKEMQKQQLPAWKMQKLKGRKHSFEIYYDESQQLKVKDVKNNQECEVQWSDRAQKYKIKKSDGQIRYMSKEQIESYIISQEIIKDYTEQDYNLRSSVESTIHEVFHRLGRRQKTKYRGIIKHHWYALMRALAVNISRITRYLSKKSSIPTFLVIVVLMKAYLGKKTHLNLKF